MARKYGIFLVIPTLVLAFTLLLKLATGPYWLAPNFDPSYQYLINGLYLIKGFVPNHTDHPGTPLQMLCAAVSWIFNPGQSSVDIVKNVLTNPEYFLYIVFILLSLFSFVTSLILAVYVFRKTKDWLAAVITQCPTLLFLVLKSWETSQPVLPVVANVSPEPVLISVVNLFNLCLLMCFFAKSPQEETWACLWMGFLGGLGVAVKLTFMPLLVIPLIFLSWKNKFIFIGTSVASFILWTLPIISKYPIIWGWINGIARQKSSGALSMEFLVGFIVVTAVILVLKLVKRSANKNAFFLLALAFGILLQFFVVLKHPGAHYLLPGLGLLGVLGFFIYWPLMARSILGQRIVLVMIVAIALGAGWQTLNYYLRLKALTGQMLAFQQQVDSKYQNCIYIDYYRSSSPEGALFFGDGWNLSPQLGEELSKIYPGRYYFNIWGNRISNFNERVWSNDLINQNSCVLFRGDGEFDFSPGPFTVKLLEKGRFENIYGLSQTTEKQGALFLAGSMQLFQSGDYAKALLYALQARKFHYQPDTSIDSVINLLKPYVEHQLNPS